MDFHTFEPVLNGEHGSEKKRWFVLRESRYLGPCSARQLMLMLEQGELGPADPIWAAGMGAWSSLEELSRAEAQAPERARPAPTIQFAFPPDASAQAEPGRAFRWIGFALSLAIFAAAGSLLFFARGTVPSQPIQAKPAAPIEPGELGQLADTLASQLEETITVFDSIQSRYRSGQATPMELSRQWETFHSRWSALEAQFDSRPGSSAELARALQAIGALHDAQAAYLRGDLEADAGARSIALLAARARDALVLLRSPGNGQNLPR